MEKCAGIYRIVNSVNGKQYIGSSSNLSERRYQHYWALDHGRHVNLHLQQAYDKYGKSAFTFETLLLCSADICTLLFYEQRSLDVLQPEYNVAPFAGRLVGYEKAPKQFVHQRVQSSTTREAISNSMMGNKNRLGYHNSSEHNAAVSKAHKGTSPWNKGKILGPYPKARCLAVSRALTGRKLSVEHIAALKAAQKAKRSV